MRILSLYEVRNSRIHGKGCFATTFIPKGTVVEEYTGKIISEDTYQQLVLLDKADHVVDCNGVFIDGMQGGNDAKFINHSCEPNLDYFIVDAHFFFRAKRDIQSGEELTWDYEYDEPVVYPCACGTKACRGFMNYPS